MKLPVNEPENAPSPTSTTVVTLLTIEYEAVSAYEEDSEYEDEIAVDAESALSA